ncbi:hypothetical protein ACX80W_01240 [Arthrobacter sp. TMN-37]
MTEADRGSGASLRSLSWRSSTGERPDVHYVLSVAGIDRYRTLFAANPSRDWLRFDGALYWSGAGDEEATASATPLGGSTPTTRA